MSDSPTGKKWSRVEQLNTQLARTNMEKRLTRGLNPLPYLHGFQVALDHWADANGRHTDTWNELQD